jgi:hypothetical protein
MQKCSAISDPASLLSDGEQREIRNASKKKIKDL